MLTNFPGTQTLNHIQLQFASKLNKQLVKFLKMYQLTHIANEPSF